MKLLRIVGFALITTLTVVACSKGSDNNNNRRYEDDYAGGYGGRSCGVDYYGQIREAYGRGMCRTGEVDLGGECGRKISCRYLYGGSGYGGGGGYGGGYGGYRY